MHFNINKNIQSIRRQLRDKYNFTPVGGSAEDPIFKSIPDGEYDIEFAGHPEKLTVQENCISSPSLSIFRKHGQYYLPIPLSAPTDIRPHEAPIPPRNPLFERNSLQPAEDPPSDFSAQTMSNVDQMRAFHEMQKQLPNETDQSWRIRIHDAFSMPILSPGHVLPDEPAPTPSPYATMFQHMGVTHRSVSLCIDIAQSIVSNKIDAIWAMERFRGYSRKRGLDFGDLPVSTMLPNSNSRRTHSDCAVVLDEWPDLPENHTPSMASAHIKELIKKRGSRATTFQINMPKGFSMEDICWLPRP